VRPTIYWMDWSALAIVLLLWIFAAFFRDVIGHAVMPAAALAVFPLLMIVLMRMIRFAGYLDELTFREWFDHDLGIIGYRTLYRCMWAVQRFFTQPGLVGTLCFCLCLIASGWGLFRMIRALDGWAATVMLADALAAFGLMIWPLVVRRDRQSWPDI
jgi:hypothetical protein